MKQDIYKLAELLMSSKNIEESAIILKEFADKQYLLGRVSVFQELNRDSNEKNDQIHNREKFLIDIIKADEADGLYNL